MRSTSLWLSLLLCSIPLAALAESEVQLSTGCSVPDLTRIATAGPYFAVSQPPAHGVLLFELSDGAPRLLTMVEAFGQNAGQFDRPGGLALDAKRRLFFVSDTNNHRVQVFRLEEQTGRLRFAKAVGRKGTGPLELDRPGELALDAGGNLFVIDAGNSRVQVLNPDLQFVRTFGEAGDGQLRQPLSLATAPDGELVYVVDAGQRRVQVFDREGRFRFSAGAGREPGMPAGSPGFFLYPFGVAVAKDGTVYVSDCGDHVVQIFDREGASRGVWGAFGTGNGALNQPRQIAIDARERVIVLDFVDRRGQIFSRAGGFLETFRLTRSALGMARVPATPVR